MAVRNGVAVWEGKLRDGKGKLKVGSGVFEGAYTFASRFEKAKGTNPEELIGAAHAGCFSMAFSLMLEKAGYDPQHIWTQADVHLEKVDDDFKITTIDLKTEAKVPEIDEETFQEQAQAAKEGCPVSQLLAGANITLEAKLVQ